ncbi:MAG: metallophosphoesterase [Euryarchaeota archaeon]|nr:metallophosphoesterase [Euryarchaeota archaeon]
MKNDLYDNIVGLVVSMRRDGSSYMEVSDAIMETYNQRYTPDGVRSIWRRNREDVPEQADDSLLERTAEAISNNKGWSFPEICKAMRDGQQLQQSFDKRQYEAKVAVDTSKPIAITFVSDVHFGNQHTDYEAFERDIATIVESPDVYLFKGGDWPDKFMPTFKDGTAVLGQLTPPQTQVLIIEKMMDYLGDKILVAIGGNHDKMDEKLTGISSEYMIHKGKPFPYLHEGGLIKLLVGKTSYNFLWKHHYRFNSSVNQFNSHHRMLEQLYPDTDIVVTEHEHNPGIEVVEKYEYDARRQVVNIRTGTYKIDDPYSMARWKAGRPGPQTVVLFPDQKKIVPFTGGDAINDAKKYIAGQETHSDKNHRSGVSR